GDIPVSWTTRNRVEQGGALIDALAPSVAPDFMTRTALCVRDAVNAVVVERTDIAGNVATVRLPLAGDYTIELYTINENGNSMQKVLLPVALTAGAAVDAPVIVAEVWSGTPEAIVDAGGG